MNTFDTSSRTQAQKSTSAFVRFGDWLSGASSDRSGLTEVTIRMMKDDCHLATTISEIEAPQKSGMLSAKEVEAIMGNDRIERLCHETGQSPVAVETALRDVLPMLASMLRESPERLYSYQCKIN